MTLVTGGTGFIGAYIIRELVQTGQPVRALRRHSTLPFFIEPEILQQVEWVEADVLDVDRLGEVMKGVSRVIHAAAMVSFHRSDRSMMLKVNIEGTANMVNAAIESGVSRFVHLSSVAALGRTPGDALVNEEKKWEDNHVQTAYAISKYKGEMEVWRGMGEGLNTVILNPSTVLGYGDWNRSSCALFRNIYRGFPWYTEGVNGFVDVEDVARAAVQLMNSEIRNEKFIISGENLSFKNLFFDMADRLQKPRPYRQASAWQGELAWRFEKWKGLVTGKRPLLTRESARVAHSRTRFDSSKLLKTLPGFQFTPIAETVKRAARQYLAKPQP